MNYEQLSNDYLRIEKTIIFLENNFHKQPTLKEVADSIYLSEYHFQRLFSRWVGISPKRFLQFLTKEYAKQLLKESRNLLNVTFKTGLSSPGRLHDLFLTCEGVTPGEYKNQGEGVVISYGFHHTPFGECLLALSEKGICSLSFSDQNKSEETLLNLKVKWANAELYENTAYTQPYINQIFKQSKANKSGGLHLLLKGTNFQIKVWEALLKIQSGTVVSYVDIADFIGMPHASRAVGNAVARNPIAYLIPCHRVIRKIGDFGNYRWGSARKKAILGWEAAQISHHKDIDAEVEYA